MVYLLVIAHLGGKSGELHGVGAVLLAQAKWLL